MPNAFTRFFVTGSFVAAAACALAPTPGLAQSIEEIDRQLSEQDGIDVQEVGPYIGGTFSYFDVEDSEVESVNGLPPAAATDLDLEDGLGGFTAFGYDHGPFRTELELGARAYEIDQVRFAGVPSPGADGNVFELSLMFNGFIDIPVAPKVEAYIGGGVGAAYFYADVNAPGLSDTSEVVVFAYQAMAGLQFEVAPRLYLNAGYRFHGTDDLNFDGVRYESPDLHGIDLGIRYIF